MARPLALVRIALVGMLSVALVSCGGNESGGEGNSGGVGSGVPDTGAPGQSTPSVPAPGTACSKEGEQTGMQNGTLVCTADPGTGELHWQVLGGGQGGGSNGQSGQGQSGVRVGDQCSTDGAVGLSDGGVTICDAGRVRYALSNDIPPPPAGGYTSRPEWYPTLQQIFGDETAKCPNGKVTLDHPFLPLEHLTRSLPAGMMIGDHVTPIDHMYLGIDTLDAAPATLTDADFLPVTAPGDGVIIEASALGDPGSHRVVIVHGCGIVSVFMVVNRLTGVLADVADSIDKGGRLPAPIPVKAGEEFGAQRDNPLDFNIFDGSTWLPGFVNPFSYASGEPWKPYTTDPATVFAPAVWDKIAATIQRTEAPRWGVIDRDVPGTAAGSWFLDGTIGYSGLSDDVVKAATSGLLSGPVDGKNITSWNHLSLSPHPVDPTAWIFSIGTWSNPDGDGRQLMIDLNGKPAPNTSKVGDAPVVYRLAQPSVVQPPGFSKVDGSQSPDGIGYTLTAGSQTEGWVVVQVVDDLHVVIEKVVGNVPAPTGFGANRQTFHR